MVPFYILVVAVVIFRGLGAAGVKPLASWAAAGRWGLTAMFVFTGATHFTGMRDDYLAMIPFGGLRQPWVIFLTGVFEIAGAIGIQVRFFRRPAAIGLILLLVAMFPANIFAAVKDIPFQDRPPTPWPLRLAIQLVFVSAIGSSCLYGYPKRGNRPVSDDL